MSQPDGNQVSDAQKKQGDDFYAARYAPERQSLQDALFREVYDDYCGQSSWTSTANYDRFTRWLDLTPYSRVLDTACGGGGPTLRLARFAGCSVVGTDINADAIARATARAHEQGLSDRVQFERQDASQPLPFLDNAFDAVLCIDALVHLSDRARIFAEWTRVLKPGGRLLFTSAVLTGPISNAELAARSLSVLVLLVPPGYDERLLGMVGLVLLRREDTTASLAEIARRHCAARAAHATALRTLEGEAAFAAQNKYRAVAERLASARRLSQIAFLAQKPP
jgi:SAM-dependent methyltransferase